MASSDVSNPERSRPIAIAPAPSPTHLAAALNQPMPYTCQTCAKRKVKCDKAAPTCSTCRKAKLDCLYQAPAPRLRKRKLSNDSLVERLARYERILHQHGLLLLDTEPSLSLRWSEPETSGTGNLHTGPGKSRYIDSALWRHLGVSSDDGNEESQGVGGAAASPASDPLTAAFLAFGSAQNLSLLEYHPTHVEAMLLWEAYAANVEPIYKVLHVPSAVQAIEMASRRPEMISDSKECLLFAVYHFAVFSMAEEDCLRILGQPRAASLQRYYFATHQALVNASFLRTTELSVLQALVLFLLPCRYLYDPQTFWILTGVAVRIAQRMGLHRDGATLGLPPFDVQMRRRLFYQLLPLDGLASQMSGISIPVIPDTWDTQLPLSINDDQMWQGMTSLPEEQKGATDMMFCLSRLCVGQFFSSLGKQPRDHGEAELAISKAESEVEEKYIRYCDIVNPLHFLTIGLARSGITALRLRIRLPNVRSQDATNAERRAAFKLAEKIMDTDIAAYAHAGLRKYRWYVKPFFLWGTWDSLILVLTTLWRRDGLLSASETRAAWEKVGQVYQNHAELLELKQALHVAFGRLTLKAWDAQQPSNGSPEPSFITTLRCLQSPRNPTSEPKDAEVAEKACVGVPSVNDASAASPGGSLSGRIHAGNDLDLDVEDWISWDRLIQDQAQSGGGYQNMFSDDPQAG
ncbi:fungal-specific transcription factor domain-containing protein [Lasiosphaeris hirsuta]|uniref:Fungal-specific transcription factor domain-containing protein n=1 Tax=Lasiosphaeris hirsuta TaxID=260670 RepID=A0AA40DJL7_9PEZI|nr:fungal-specific transcription factor domain-containing protein [Lasiosphaeris hirsuta]